MNVLASFGFDDLRLVNFFGREGKSFGRSSCRRRLLFLWLRRLLCCRTFRRCFGFWSCLFGCFSFWSRLLGCFSFWSRLFGGRLLFTSFALRFCFVRFCGIRFFSHVSRCYTLPALASGLRITPTVLRCPLR